MTLPDTRILVAATDQLIRRGPPMLAVIRCVAVRLGRIRANKVVLGAGLRVDGFAIGFGGGSKAVIDTFDLDELTGGLG